MGKIPIQYFQKRSVLAISVISYNNAVYQVKYIIYIYTTKYNIYQINVKVTESNLIVE